MALKMVHQEGRQSLLKFAKQLEDLERRHSLQGPETDEELDAWLKDKLGIDVPKTSVCEGHVAPFTFLADLYFERVNSAIALASRGGSKTFLIAVLHLLNCLFKAGVECATVGAIQAQSDRAYLHFQKLLESYGKQYISSSIISKTKFTNGSVLEILGGCLPTHACVQTPYGNMRIGEIVSKKLDGPVKTFNFKTGEFEWAKITDWHVNGKGSDWLKFKLDISTLQGPSDLNCTPGHRLMKVDGTKDNAMNFSVDDDLCVTTQVMSEEQEQILMGMLLGDGHASTNSRYRIDHATHQLAYLEWFANAFCEFNPYWNRRESKGTFSVDLNCARRFSELRKEWYPDGTKRIPDYVWEKLDLLGLACWLMDDGCWTISGPSRQSRSGKWTISAMNFNAHERQKVSEHFDELGIDGKWACVDRSRDQWIWQTTKGFGVVLQSLVSDYIDVSRKLEKGYKNWMADLILHHSKPGITTAKIKDIVVCNTQQTRYDITVPPHANYVVSSGLVVSNTVSQVNGPHPMKVHIDELELMDPDVYEESRNMRQSKTINGKVISGQDIITSTRKRGHGPMQQLMDEVAEAELKGNEPPFKVYSWCVYEVAQKVKNCQVANPHLPASERCPCDRVVKGLWENGSPRSLKDCCSGRLARSEGWIPFDDLVNIFTKVSQSMWEAQQECSRPSTEGIVFPQFARERHGIRKWMPDPALGPIYMGYDPGGTNPSAVGWYQVLRYEVETTSFLGPPRRLKEGSRILFDEIYLAEVGNNKIADMIVQREAYWRGRFKAFRVHRRFCDPQAKAARLDLAKHVPPLPTIFVAKRDVKEDVKTVSNLLDDDLLFVDVTRCEMFVEEMESYHYPRKRAAMIDDPEKPVDDFDHMISTLRYAMSNIHVLELGENRSRQLPMGQEKPRTNIAAAPGMPAYAASPDGLPMSAQWRRSLGTSITR